MAKAFSSLLLVAWFLFSVVTEGKSQDGRGHHRHADEPIVADTATEAKELKRISQQHGVQHAYEYLKHKWQRDQIAGHDLAHLVGRLAYEQLGDKGFGICDANFGFGCYHGLMATLIKQQGSAGIESARRACNSLAPRGQALSCLHGIGHGIMDWKGELNAAVSTCQGFPPEDRLSCFDGVFMEYYTAIVRGAGQKAGTAGNNSGYFCSSFPKEAQTQCVRNQVIYIFSTKPEGYRDIAASCMTLVSDMQPFCTHTFGLMATRQGGTDKIIEMCSAFPKASMQKDCIIAGAEEIVFQNRSPQSAHTLCSSLGHSDREGCEVAISGTMARFGLK